MEIRLELEAKKDGRTIFLFLVHRQVGARHPTHQYILAKVNALPYQYCGSGSRSDFPCN